MHTRNTATKGYGSSNPSKASASSPGYDASRYGTSGYGASQDYRIKRKSENKKERRGMATDSDLVAQAYYVDANEQDWSFEADNKPRKTPMGFDR